MANWLKKTFDSGVRKGLAAAEDKVKSETKLTSKNVYSKARKEYNKSVDNDPMFGENTKFPKGMVPVGDKGFYTSPNTGNFDPRDCSNPRNSTSPWCGYNPISTKPIDVGIDLQLNGCGGFIKWKTTLGFIDFPPVYAGYLKDECREDYKKENNKDLPPVVTIPPGFEIVPPPENFPPTPSSDPPKLGSNCLYIVVLGKVVASRSIRTETQRGNGFVPCSAAGMRTLFPDKNAWSYASRSSSETYYSQAQNSRSLSPSTSLGEPVLINGSYFWTGSTITMDGRDERVTENGNNRFYFGLDPKEQRTSIQDYTGWQNWEHSELRKYQDTSPLRVAPPWEAASQYTRDSLEATWMSQRYNLYPAIINKEYNTNTQLVGGAPDPDIFAGYGADILRYFAECNWTNGNFPDTSIHKYKTSYFILEIYEFPCPTSPAWDYPPFKQDCMPCCCPSDKPNPQQQKQDDEILKLLREMNKKLGDFPRPVEVYDDDPDTVERQKVTKTIPSISLAIEHIQKQFNNTLQVLGIEELPVSYPDSLVKPIPMNGIEQLWDWVVPDKTRKIKSVIQFQDWAIEQFSAVMGQWHQYLEYEDDKGKKQKIGYADVGTLGIQLVKQGVSTVQAVGLLTDICLKALQESTNASLMTAEALKRITDVQDYLDYPTQMKKGSYPAGITPSKDVKNLIEYLQNSNLMYQWDDWTPELGQSHQEQMNQLFLILTAMRATQGGE